MAVKQKGACAQTIAFDSGVRPALEPKENLEDMLALIKWVGFFHPSSVGLY
jgi:hypothetical protein